jgi:ribonuclease HI
MTADATGARATYHFDGGCRPNPGPREMAVVSRGRTWFRDDLGIGDNNEAEWAALLHAAELAQADGAGNVLFVGDSALVVEQASGRQPCRSPHLQPYLDAFRAAAAAFVRVRLRHVPRSKNLAGIALARRASSGGPGAVPRR